jgi:hypothetical protein
MTVVLLLEVRITDEVSPAGESARRTLERLPSVAVHAGTSSSHPRRASESPVMILPAKVPSSWPVRPVFCPMFGRQGRIICGECGIPCTDHRDGQYRLADLLKAVALGGFPGYSPTAANVLLQMVSGS